MKFKSLDGNEFIVNVAQNKYPIKDQDNCKSKFQYELGQILISIYPNFPILEEFYIPQEKLYLDFFIPKLRLSFEAQGEQHDQFNPFFHKHYFQFAKSQDRDYKKSEWCKLNDIKLVQVPYGKIDKNTLLKLIQLV